MIYWRTWWFHWIHHSLFDPAIFWLEICIMTITIIIPIYIYTFNKCSSYELVKFQVDIYSFILWPSSPVVITVFTVSVCSGPAGSGTASSLPLSPRLKCCHSLINTLYFIPLWILEVSTGLFIIQTHLYYIVLLETWGRQIVLYLTVFTDLWRYKLPCVHSVWSCVLYVVLHKITAHLLTDHSAPDLHIH